MAKRFSKITESHVAFMLRQNIFFVASAVGDSHVNVSPRSTDYFRHCGSSTVAYLDRTGSGNETAAHIRAKGRMTIMFCSVEGSPMILRLYGYGTVHSLRCESYISMLDKHFESKAPLGTRQIITLSVATVHTSCGFGVPLFDYRGTRTSLDRWTENKGESGIIDYWIEKTYQA